MAAESPAEPAPTIMTSQLSMTSNLLLEIDWVDEVYELFDFQRGFGAITNRTKKVYALCGTMTIEVELKEIKSLLSEVNKKLDSLLEERETEIVMTLEEQTLREFLAEEPDIYSIKDLKRKVSCN